MSHFKHTAPKSAKLPFLTPKSRAKRVARALALVKFSRRARPFLAPALATLVFLCADAARLLDAFFPWSYALAFGLLLAWLLHAASRAQRLALSAPLSAAQIYKILHQPHRRFAAGESVEARQFRFILRAMMWRTFLRRVHMPAFFVRCATRDPQGVYPWLWGSVFALVACLWLAAGNSVLTHYAPSVTSQWQTVPDAVTVWIEPPSFAHEKPILLASPDGAHLMTPSAVRVPSGSRVSVHYQGDAPPTVQANNRTYTLTKQEDGDYVLNEALVNGSALSLARGTQSLGYWHVSLTKLAPPKPRFAAKPTFTEHKTLRIEVTMKSSVPLAHGTLLIAPVGDTTAPETEIPLMTPLSMSWHEVFYPDATSSPYAGQAVTLQLRAEDEAGQTSFSEKVGVTLPERTFSHPMAEALREVRRQLALHDNEMTRGDAANLMAMLATQPEAFHKDPVVLMALRTGALRLLVDPDPVVGVIVQKTLWQAAVRIEEGVVGQTREDARSALAEMALAVDGREDPSVLAARFDAVAITLTKYVDALAKRILQQKSKDKGQAVLTAGSKNFDGYVFMHDAQKLQKAIEENDIDAARHSVAALQQTVETVKLMPLSTSDDQKRLTQQVRSLRTLTESQQKVLDDTEKAARLGQNEETAKKLSEKQEKLVKRLGEILSKTDASAQPLRSAQRAMIGAVDCLHKGDFQAAAVRQKEAISLLRKGVLALLEEISTHNPGLLSLRF